MPRILLLLVVVALAGCDQFKPARITAGRSDTVVVNNVRQTRLAAHSLNRHGDTLSEQPVLWRRVGGDARSLAPEGVVDCSWRGNVEAEVASGDVAARVAILCRPIMMLYFEPGGPIRLKGGPVPYGLSAVGNDGQPVLQIAGTVLLEDTTIVTTDNGRIVPRRAGETQLRVTAGDCDAYAPVIVEDPVATIDSLALYRPYETHVSLVAGEHQTLRVPPGLAFITLTGDSASLASLQLAASRASCARLKSVASGISCLLADTSRIVVRNTDQTQQAMAAIRIERRLSTSWPAVRQVRQSSGSSKTSYCTLMLSPSAG
jgi:hypothetical protein